MNESRLAKERGQSLILVAAALVVLVAFGAVAVDLSNAYYNRRTAQNAADGAALAGVSEMAIEINHRNKRVDLNIQAAMNDFAERNGIQDTDGIPANWLNKNVEGWYVDTAGNRIPDLYGVDIKVGEAPGHTVPDDAYGIEAITHITATAFFGGIFGFDGYPVQARAVSLLKQACSADCVVPIVTQMDVFFDADGELLINSCFNIYSEAEEGEPGSYGWVAWTWQETACEDGSRPCPIPQGSDPCSETTLADNLNPDNCASGYVEQGDWVANSTGIATSSDILCYLDYYLGIPDIDGKCPVSSTVPLPFTIPVYDYTNVSYFTNENPAACGGTVTFGELSLPGKWGLHYHIAGFAKMQILGYMLSQGLGETEQILNPEEFGLPADFIPERDCITLGAEPHDGNRITALLQNFVTDFTPSQECYDPVGTLLAAPRLTE